MDEEPINRRWITQAQWIAARAVSEGAHPTRKRVAAVLGCDDSAVYARAALEEWKRLDFRSMAVRDLHEEMMAAAGHGGRAGARAAGGGEEDAADDAEEAGGERTGIADGGWRDGDGGDGGGGGFASDPDGDPASMPASASGFLSRQLARLMARADRRGGRLDKRDIDGLAALARMMERWETLATERTRQEETESDDQIAELLEKINDRIAVLARTEAARLVAAGYRP